MPCSPPSSTAPSKQRYDMNTTTPFSLRIFVIALLVMTSGSAGADTIYVSNIGDSSVRTVDQNGAVSFFADNGFNYPSGLAFDGAGNLYASSFYGDQIKVFSPSGSATVFASVDDGGE